MSNTAEVNSGERDSSFVSVLELTPDAVVCVRPTGEIAFVNRQAGTLFGYRRDELLGRQLEVLVPQRLQEAHESDRAGFFTDPHTRPMATDLSLFAVRKDGTEFPAEISLATIESDQGVLAVAAIRDISDRLDGERERELLRELTAVQRQAIEELRHSRQETVDRLARAIALHDPATGEHTRRMAVIASYLASGLGLDAERVELLRAAAPMHDVGKVGIPAEILRKPGALTAEERAEMKRHTRIGEEILAGSESELLCMAATIALTHHEWFDGSGYPQGLAGEEIPIEGRIVAVADVFDALLDDRTYRPAMSVAEAVDVMRRGRGTHFDPRVVDLLLDHLEEALSTRG